MGDVVVMIANKSLENVIDFKYLGTKATKKSCIHE
jgi:hypothetical protein